MYFITPKNEIFVEITLLRHLEIDSDDWLIILTLTDCIHYSD